jgi:hypothetical protein
VQHVVAGLRRGKQELLGCIIEFEHMQKQSGVQITFAEWLEETKVNYEKLTHTF